MADQIDAMLAYWDSNLVCRFANKAYVQWFGKSPEEMIDKITMRELLGPLFEMNLPYVQGALEGRKQVFEREIPTPTGYIRHALATYYPDISEGAVRGFFVHVAETTQLKKLAMERENLILDLRAALGQIKSLSGLLPICAWCKKIRDDDGYWKEIGAYLAERTNLSVSHGICVACETKLKESKNPS
ncbi:MAG: PAS domain-containing protein [Fibrobacteria bacterium]